MLEKNSSRPLVSVIIPAYNAERFIETTLNSVFTQTYENLQVIVVNDASTDATASILSEIVDPRLEIVNVPVNGHASAARNLALTRAKGEYIAFLDSDDIWYPSKIEKQIAFLEAEPEYGVCFTWSKIIDENGVERTPDNAEVAWLYNAFHEKDREHADWLLRMLTGGNFIMSCSAVVRGDVLRQVGGQNTSLLQLHDLEHWVRILSVCRPKMLCEELVAYRRVFGSDSISSVNEVTRTRTSNEDAFVCAHFFDHISDELFLQLFRKHLCNRDAHTPEQIACEKAFLLSRAYCAPEPFLQNIQNLMSNPATAAVLRLEYGYTAKQFYADNASRRYYDRGFHYQLQDERENFRREILNREGHIEQLLQSERTLSAELETVQNTLSGQLENALIERDQLRDKENQLRGELIRAQCAKNDLENDLRGQLTLMECAKNDLENDLTGQLNNAVIERDQLRDKENALNAQLSSVSLERDVLSERVVKYSYDLDRMREAEEELRGKLMCSEGECAQLRDKENQLLRTVSNKDAEYAALKHELACREAECAQLRGKENQLKADLEATRNSRTWRLARVFAGFVRFFVPVGSKRALFLRLLWTFIKHPFKFLKSLSPRKMKKFFRLLRRGDVEGIKLLIHSNITGVPAPSTIEVIAPEVVPVESEPVREKTVADYPVIRVPQWEDPQVSIIIPVYNQFEFTYHCVESIIRNSGDITYEILIANDCSTDLTTHIDEILPGVKCITNEKNLRFLLNCNNAAKYAKGKYVLFLNNDTQVQPNWLEPLVTLIESADDIGMVGSKLIYPDGLLQEAGGILWKDGSAWNFGNRQNPALPQFNYVKQVDYISGAAIMLSRALWEEIGGFDETFVTAYCEDSDLAFTVRKMGYRVMYQPLSVVVHFEGVSNGTDTSSGQKHYQVVNSKKFREKWAEELAKHPENAENVFQARDYSFGKPTLLMVDHYVPHFDKDAGSRTVYQYLRLFVKAGFNVKFIGDNFYQHEPYTTALQQMDVEVLYGPECAQHWKDWIRDNAEHIDYVFLNRPHIAPKYLEFIRQNTKARIIYYGHDLAFLREMREFEITGDSSFRDSAIEWKPKELALMRAADMAYYPSYVEVDEIHAIDPTVKVKAIPAYLFENVKWEGYDHGARKDIMFIGGFGHRPNVDAVKWIADEILPELLKYLPDVKIHILGSNAPKEVLELANEHLIIEGFVTDEQLEWFYRNMRISLVPLRYGAGIKGKVVEAMRFGTPVVTTSTGAEGIPDAEKAMLIEDDGKELARKLAELYNDAEKLVSMSENCIGYIQDNYSPSNAIRVIGPEFDLC